MSDSKGHVSREGILYERKPAEYFSGARADWISLLPENLEAKILEIGCGAGGTGALAIHERKCGWFAGIELMESPAKRAREVLSEVLCGNVETIHFPWKEQTFDVLFMSEVLEHLADPWEALRRLKSLLKPGALVFASSPNVAHFSTIKMLLSGRWDLGDWGMRDRTHLRWFTPKSFRDLFQACGFKVDDVRPHVALRWKSRLAVALMLGRGSHLFHQQIDLQAHVPENC
jgi:2-polyprenyl-3-methyl-5-hydroxy-6-metoxy-1,4-benzoquinol methylase